MCQPSPGLGACGLTIPVYWNGMSPDLCFADASCHSNLDLKVTSSKRPSLTWRAPTLLLKHSYLDIALLLSVGLFIYLFCSCLLPVSPTKNVNYSRLENMPILLAIVPLVSRRTLICNRTQKAFGEQINKLVNQFIYEFLLYLYMIIIVDKKNFNVYFAS